MRAPLTLLFILLLGAARAQADEGDPLHVVLVLLDDVGVDKIGAYGHPTAGPTPVIDSLAAGGLRFGRAYSQPTCSPTRACILTGRYGSRTGVDTGLPTYNPEDNPNGSFAPSLAEPWLPRLLQDGGARSYLVGKWHLNHVGVPDYHQHPILCGFARWRGHLSNILVGQGEGFYSWNKQVADGVGWHEKPSTTFVTVDNALEGFLALQASAGRRSLVCLWFNAPHPPWSELPPPDSYMPVGGVQTQPVLQQYALQSVDTYLGQMMSFYEQALPADAARTLWLVMGDNGTPKAAIEFPTPSNWHKAEVYEGGVRVPLIAYGSGVRAPGRVTDHLVHAVDLWATLLDVFNRDHGSEPTDSVSFAPVLLDSSAPSGRSVVYVRHAEPNGFGPKAWREHAATDGTWKLIRRSGELPLSPAVELYNLEADPLESTNLWPASTPEEQAAVALLDPVLTNGDQPTP